MKNILQLACIAIFLHGSSLQALGQTHVECSIHHLLNGSDFEFNLPVENNRGDRISCDRLSYYLSELKVDTATDDWLTIDSSWVLIDASETPTILRFEIPETVTQINGFGFSIGVDSTHNHMDPATWPSDHPLAPKNPSMHWGWAAGYRFVALEGMSGTDLDFDYQLHGLGDENYFSVSLPQSAWKSQDTIKVQAFANYVQAFHDINMSEGQISHGSDGEALQSLINFRDRVFTSENPGLPPVGINDPTYGSVNSLFYDQTQQKIRLAANPSNPTINAITIYDLTGKQVALSTLQQGAFDIPSLPDGLYIAKPLANATVKPFKFFYTH